MPKIKSFNIENLSQSQKRDLNKLSDDISVSKRGIQGDILLEPKPNPIIRKGSRFIQGSNNSDITLGTDQPGEIGSGYSKETGAGSIDLVAGRMSSNIQTQLENPRGNNSVPLYVDNNLSLDASRISICQKTDIDANFRLVKGRSGNSIARAGIAIKSDAIRIMSRDGGVKIVSGVDNSNSLGGKVSSVPRIEFLAGNTDRNLQATTKSDKNNRVMKDILNRIDELNSALDTFITAQTEFNNQVSIHNHLDVTLQAVGTMAGGGPGMINGGKGLPSPELMSAGPKAFSTEMIGKFDNIINKLKAAVLELNGLEVYGDKQSGSKSVFTG